MYDYISGTLVHADEDFAVIDNEGIGYRMRISSMTRQKLPEHDKFLLLYIHTVHRDDNLELYGFVSREERKLFDRLLDVSGIGPRQSLKILSGLDEKTLIQAIVNEDLAILTSISGLGKRTAEKLVFELSGKLDDLVPAVGAEAGTGGDGEAATGAALQQEAAAALESLGYSGLAARNAVQNAARENRDSAFKDLESLIRASLRHV